jgi:hypothetical protein
LPIIKIKLKLTSAQYADIREICRLRKLIIGGGLEDVQKYSAELIDARMAGFRSLFWQLRQMITDSGEDFEKFAFKLISADVREFRSLRIGKNFLFPQREDPPPPKVLSSKREKLRISAEIVKKILLLYERGEINAPRIAERLGISVMKVHRTIQNHKTERQNG